MLHRSKLVHSYLFNFVTYMDIGCSICLDDIHPPHKITMTPCEHIYHSNCLENYALKKKDEGLNIFPCPLCRAELSTNTSSIPFGESDDENLPNIIYQSPAIVIVAMPILHTNNVVTRKQCTINSKIFAILIAMTIGTLFSVLILCV